MNDATAMPSKNDLEFFREIGDHIKANRDSYRAAGEWLDKDYSDAAFEKRERTTRRELLRKKKAGPLSSRALSPTAERLSGKDLLRTAPQAATHHTKLS